MSLIAPHASRELMPLLVQGDERQRLLAHAKTLQPLKITSREAGDLIMMGIGGFTPLQSFMGKADWQSVCENMALSDGTFWPIPITLSVDKDRVTLGEEVALVFENEILAVLTIEEMYSCDKAYEAEQVFKTNSDQHPGVVALMQQKDLNVSGQLRVLSEGSFPNAFSGLYQTPAKVRAQFDALGWETIVAFQTRNPMHRAHEALVREALSVADGVLVHMLLGKVKAGDLPADVRAEAIDALLQHHFESNEVCLAGYPLDMRYAGPREALLHALFRQNYGCSHIIIGRDHAGVGDFYGPYEAQEIFQKIPKKALSIQPVFMEAHFWCNGCQAMTTLSKCPHSSDLHLNISGTELRSRLSEGLEIPEQFSRSEVLEVLRDYYRR